MICRKCFHFMRPDRSRLPRSHGTRGDATVHYALGLCLECVPLCYHDGYYFVAQLSRAFCRDCGGAIPMAAAKPTPRLSGGEL
jgi:hypothetical protein